MRTSNPFFPFTTILVALWSLTGCGPAPVVAEAVDLDPEGWLATDTVGRGLGYGVMTMAVGEAHLLNLCVDPSRQRQGLARHLLDHLVDIARHADTEQLFLEVRGSNLAALALYAAYGFVQVGVRPGYYPAEQGREDARVLSLYIGGRR